jgi:tRNA(Arg) A34 adenosine deaminase TadA
MQKAIALAVGSVRDGGGPFGALIVGEGGIISEAVNRVTKLNDPTAHAEILAIRYACRQMGRFELRGFDLFATCEPCPMCLAAAYWSRVDRVFFAATRAEAAAVGFDDELIYSEMASAPTERSIRMIQIRPAQSGSEFEAWRQFPGRTQY